MVGAGHRGVNLGLGLDAMHGCMRTNDGLRNLNPCSKPHCRERLVEFYSSYGSLLSRFLRRETKQVRRTRMRRRRKKKK